MTRIIHHARAYLGRRGAAGPAFAEAVRIDDGRITAAGSGADLLDGAPAGAERIDAGGRLVLPAFRDSHLHFHWLGRRAGMIECAGAASIDDVIRRGRELIRRIAPPAGAYVQGAGVNPDRFTEGERRDLDRRDVDRIDRDRPVILSRHCGHTIYCNSLALKRAGFDERAPEVDGGTFEKDAGGRPTGVVRENACALVRAPTPPPGPAETRAALERAMRTALSLGVTAVGSYDTGGPDFDAVAGAYREIYAAGGPAARVSMQCGISAREDFLDNYIDRGLTSGKALWEDHRGPMLTMGAIKLFVDGTLGGRTAWMRAPYRDWDAAGAAPAGFPVLEPARLAALAARADRAGLQTLVHAIGDAGIDAVIGAFEALTLPGWNPLRHGIVHCQVTGPDLLARIARNHLLVLAQPAFLADDLHVLEARVGPETAATSYAWGTMDRLGVSTSYGTDAPVSPLDPLLGIAWAVLRRDPATGLPAGGFYPAERVDTAAAVDAYTAGSAYAAFAEGAFGRVRPGHWADLVFLNEDLFSLPPADIGRVRVVRTLLAGETVWERPEEEP